MPEAGRKSGAETFIMEATKLLFKYTARFVSSIRSRETEMACIFYVEIIWLWIDFNILTCIWFLFVVLNV